MVSNTDIKIICITGHSGVGKSTAAEVLRRIPNVEAISVDKFMFDSVVAFSREIETIIGFPVETKDGLEYLRKYATYLTASKVKEFMTFALPYIEGRIEAEIDSFIKMRKGKYIAFEWYYLPKCKVWDTAYSRVMIKETDWNSLLKYMRERNDYEKREEVIINRRKAVENLLANAPNVDYMIYNSYDDKFEKSINEYFLWLERCISL